MTTFYCTFCSHIFQRNHLVLACACYSLAPCICMYRNISNICLQRVSCNFYIDFQIGFKFHRVTLQCQQTAKHFIQYVLVRVRVEQLPRIQRRSFVAKSYFIFAQTKNFFSHTKHLRSRSKRLLNRRWNLRFVV